MTCGFVVAVLIYSSWGAEKEAPLQRFLTIQNDFSAVGPIVAFSDSGGLFAELFFCAAFCRSATMWLSGCRAAATIVHTSLEDRFGAAE